jgi:lactococcin 972 family bacteriocin
MKKSTTTLIGVAAAAVLVAGPVATASASASEVLGSGASSGGIVIDGPADSGSTTGSTRSAGSGDGSFWQWGVGRDDVYSNYFREKSCHGATAVGKGSNRVSNVPGGKYAKALTPKKVSGNKAYYHNC